MGFYTHEFMATGPETLMLRFKVTENNRCMESLDAKD